MTREEKNRIVKRLKLSRRRSWVFGIITLIFFFSLFIQIIQGVEVLTDVFGILALISFIFMFFFSIYGQVLETKIREYRVELIEKRHLYLRSIVFYYLRKGDIDRTRKVKKAITWSNYLSNINGLIEGYNMGIRRYDDTEADGYVFCGKCGKMK